MDFTDQIVQFSKRIENLRETITTEEATKTSIIMPFFSMLGYDVFNPNEFVPEFTADVGIKKGEKVDYAIIMDGRPVMLIEAKWIGETLDKHDSQLFRYFATTKAKFAILTNGETYKFYTDLEEANKMDEAPFLEIDLANLDESKLPELKKFCKENFDESKILDTASELKYKSIIKAVLRTQFSNPSDEFVKFILSNDVYNGMKTQGIIDKYKPLVKKAIQEFVNDQVSEKIQNALRSSDELPEVHEKDEKDEDDADYNSIITTDDEIQAFYIIRSILCEKIASERIVYKDTINYFGIILDGKVTKWICRLSLREGSKYVIIPENDQKQKYSFEKITDLYHFKQHLLNRLEELI